MFKHVFTLLWDLFSILVLVNYFKKRLSNLQRFEYVFILLVLGIFKLPTATGPSLGRDRKMVSEH